MLMPGSDFVVAVGFVAVSGGVMISMDIGYLYIIKSCIEEVPSVNRFSGTLDSSSSGRSTQSSDDNGDGCSGLWV